MHQRREQPPARSPLRTLTLPICLCLVVLGWSMDASASASPHLARAPGVHTASAALVVAQPHAVPPSVHALSVPAASADDLGSATATLAGPTKG
ncbi:MAG: hypothetical protein ABJA81_06165, partial [Nocardioidaceae bacterium]